ncbi:probable LRR receptor-like serine/threonine-protein kinase At1g07650 isoform X1 [Musa acuminata AAA Group]
MCWRLLTSSLVLALLSFPAIGSNLTRLPDDEVDALKKIAVTLGKTGWDFNVDPCNNETNWITGKDDNVTCNCNYNNNTVCHITTIILKSQNLSGTLPPEMARLRNLNIIDFTRNYLNGTIPVEWATLPLMNLSLLGNRLSGEIPQWIGNLTNLKNLDLEANQFTGHLPQELGELLNLEILHLSSNTFSGNLPVDLAKLNKIQDFRINDNRFNGKIPERIFQNWTYLYRLEMQASGFEGPSPSGIAFLKNLTELRISDINGTMSFPQLSASKIWRSLILRNCGLSGGIPEYIGNFDLKYLDLSFNNLSGAIPTTFQNLRVSDSMFLNNNNLSGPVPDWISTGKTKHIDLSYNNLTWTSHDSLDCQQGKMNLVGNSVKVSNLQPATPCLELLQCTQRQSSLYINCGGRSVHINNNGTTYEEDSESDGASNFFVSSNKNWAFSSTGVFMDNNNDNDAYVVATSSLKLSMPDSDLFKDARISPVSLTYYGLCLLEGNYSVKLHFAEIKITNDGYGSLGKRIFDIYIQGNLVWKDFNIRDEANGSGNAIIKSTNVMVTDKLEIHLYWAGNGTQSLPVRGTYGPLISAISVEPNFSLSSGKRTKIIVGIIVSVSCLIFLLLSILWKKGWLGGQTAKDRELRALDLRTGRFTLRQIKMATGNFSASNKIGEGGFGPVYKGLLPDGTIVAVKQLSSKSKQGNREFLNELGMISALQHPNLVKLHGCCIEGNQLLLVYEYMENNSLARALFGSEEYQLKLDWSTRKNICIGIAKGLAYIHEESRLKVVHRDIKATNILLDKNLNAKISDFGLARLDEEENTHISTRIAGTVGYMAPEYATRGYLTEKADVYSFGVVTLELVSGTSVMSFRKEGGMHLLDWVQILREEGKLEKFVDPRLGTDFNKEEAIRLINVGLLCINSSPVPRPPMSAVVSMLVEAQTSIVDATPEQIFSTDDFEIQVSGKRYPSSGDSQTKSFLVEGGSVHGSTTSSSDLYPLNLDSLYRNQRC